MRLPSFVWEVVGLPVPVLGSRLTGLVTDLELTLKELHHKLLALFYLVTDHKATHGPEALQDCLIMLGRTPLVTDHLHYKRASRNVRQQLSMDHATVCNRAQQSTIEKRKRPCIPKTRNKMGEKTNLNKRENLYDLVPIFMKFGEFSTAETKSTSHRCPALVCNVTQPRGSVKPLTLKHLAQ